MPALVETIDQGRHLLDGIDIGLNFIDRRSDVNMDAGNPQIFQRPILLEDALGPLNVNAELCLLRARRGVAVRFRIHIRIDPQRPHRGLARQCGHPVNVLDLCFALDIERRDSRVQCLADFVIGFSDAGVNDFRRIAAGLKCAEEFSAAGDVKAASFLGEQLADIEVAAAFDGIANRRVHRGKRLAICR